MVGKEYCQSTSVNEQPVECHDVGDLKILLLQIVFPIEKHRCEVHEHADLRKGIRTRGLDFDLAAPTIVVILTVGDYAKSPNIGSV